MTGVKVDQTFYDTALNADGNLWVSVVRNIGRAFVV
jgi:hypothetical protein